jgi:hypothetical protein
MIGKNFNVSSQKREEEKEDRANEFKEKGNSYVKLKDYNSASKFLNHK